MSQPHIGRRASTSNPACARRSATTLSRARFDRPRGSPTSKPLPDPVLHARRAREPTRSRARRSRAPRRTGWPRPRPHPGPRSEAVRPENAATSWQNHHGTPFIAGITAVCGSEQRRDRACDTGQRRPLHGDDHEILRPQLGRVGGRSRRRPARGPRPCPGTSRGCGAPRASRRARWRSPRSVSPRRAARPGIRRPRRRRRCRPSSRMPSFRVSRHRAACPAGPVSRKSPRAPRLLDCPRTHDWQAGRTITTHSPGASGCLFVLAAPSGGGKTSLVDATARARAGHPAFGVVHDAPAPSRRAGRRPLPLRRRAELHGAEGRRASSSSTRTSTATGTRRRPPGSARGAARPRRAARDRLAGRAAGAHASMPGAVLIFILPPSLASLRGAARKARPGQRRR